MKKILSVLLCLALVTGFGVCSAAAAEEAAAPAAAAPAAEGGAEAPAGPKVFKVGDKVEGLAAMDADGQKADIVKALGGKGVGVVVFMNTACSACLDELNMVNGLYRNNQAKMEMVVVSVDFGEYPVVANYKKNNRFYGVWLQDKEFAVPAAFGFSSTPSLAVIDQAGKVLYLQAGYTKRGAEKTYKTIEGFL